MLNAFTSDVRQAMRALLRARGFTVVAVATLGSGLALSVSVVTVVNAYLIRTLPYPASDRLYNVSYTEPGRPFPQGLEKLDWKSLDDVIEHPVAWDLDFFNLKGAPYAEAAQGAWVTPGFVGALGIPVALGRGLDATDFGVGRPAVALISHRLWQTRFSGEPSVIGRRFEVSSSDRPDDVETFTVVGVLPARFWHLNVFTDVLVPLRAPTYPYMVRLRTGVTAETAAAKKGFNREIEKNYEQQNPNLKPAFDKVDKVQARGVAEAELVSFLRAGGLIPEEGR